MAVSEKNSPSGQSDSPQARPVEFGRRVKRPFVVSAIVVVLVVVVVASVTVGLIDTRPRTGQLVWPEMSMDVSVSPPVFVDGTAPAPSPEGVASVLEPLLSASALKGDLAITVIDGITNEELYSADQHRPLVPASVTKVVTSVAVLESVGPGYRIPTEVFRGSRPGEVVLVGHGDVTLTRDGRGFYRNAASLEDLAGQVKQALGDEAVDTVVLDTSVFTGAVKAHGVEDGDISIGYTANMAPIMLDGGRVDKNNHHSGSQRYADPAGEAADEFARLLGATSVVDGTVSSEGEVLASVYSPTMQQLVEETLIPSDNLLADALAFQVALARDAEPSFVGASAAIIDVLSELGINTEGVTLNDGSGLSTGNRLTTAVLAESLAAAASSEYPELSGVFAGMPVAGYTGSLSHRFNGENSAGRGEVRAKTGTLTGVSSLTGTVVDNDGRLLTFAIIFNGRGTGLATENALDAITVALAECGCR